MFSIYIFGNFKPLSHFKKVPSLFTISQEYNISPAQYWQNNLLCPLKILPYSKMEETEWNKNMSECQTKAGNQEHSLTHSLSQHTEQLLFSCLCSKVTVYR